MRLCGSTNTVMDSFASAFKSEEFADVDLVLLCNSNGAGAGVTPEAEQANHKPVEASSRTSIASAVPAVAAGRVLARYPAHALLLCKCDYFRAQFKHWPPVTGTESSGRKRDRSSRDGRPELHLTLDSADQQEAAEAVIETLYLSKQALEQLTMEQLIQALLIADKLQVRTAAAGAIALFRTAMRSHVGVPLSVATCLGELGAWPKCLLPAVNSLLLRLGSATDGTAAAEQEAAVQGAVVALFGRLSDAWRDGQRIKLLLQLPEAAMRLLLSSDQLVVDSEDTVFYVATRYIAARTGRLLQPALAESIRCPYLSLNCLSALALSHGDHILHDYKIQLQQLLSLRLLSNDGSISCRVESNVPGAPNSWQKPMRSYGQQPATVATARITVQELIDACRRCCEQKTDISLSGPSVAPRAGFAWVLECTAAYRSGSAVDEGTCTLEVRVGPRATPPGALFRFDCKVVVQAAGNTLENQFSCNADHQDVETGVTYGWPDFFRTGGMAGGLNMRVWEQQGWPLEGELEFQLVITAVQGESSYNSQ